MEDYNEQVQRIQDKLGRAKQIDHKLKVFGSESHQYVLHPPASESEVAAFESRYSLQLPECYRAFVTQVGNGGNSYANAGAGPYYGIYVLGDHVDELIYENAFLYLKNDCLIYPRITAEAWDELTKPVEDDNLTDEEYEREIGRLYGGILPIGSQGCTYLHALILNGPHRGKVVNMDIDRHRPGFTFEKNFLDWYERWLDEIISGDLIGDKAGMFGFNKGGSDEELLNTYLHSDDPEERNDCLWGLLTKKSLSAGILDRIEELIQSGSEDKPAFIRLLCKSDYKRAKPYLVQFMETNLLHVLQSIFWYAKYKSREWIPAMEEQIHRITDVETFRYCTYLLQESKTDYGKLVIPFTNNGEEEIRVQAFYSLGQLDSKKDLVDVFISGLHDESNRVIHTTLQALSEVQDDRLLEHYRFLAGKFKNDEQYILTNLNHRLRDYGLTNETILNITFFNEQDAADLSGKKWFQFWK